MRMYGSFSRVVSGVPFWLCQGQQGLEEATQPPQPPPCPAAHLWLHPGWLEHEELNSYRRKKEEVWPPAPAHRGAKLRAPKVTAKGSTWTHSPPSKSTRAASTRNGAVFPTNSYSTLPKGGPTARKREKGQGRARD